MLKRLGTLQRFVVTQGYGDRLFMFGEERSLSKEKEHIEAKT